MKGEDLEAENKYISQEKQGLKIDILWENVSVC
jgi:hypothetical protein